MKDIFKVLKHEGHKLDVIKYDNDIKLGCLDCGCTLYSFNTDFDIEDFKKVYRKICKRNSKLKIFMDLFIKEIITLNEEDLKKIRKIIITEAKHQVNKESLYETLLTLKHVVDVKNLIFKVISEKFDTDKDTIKTLLIISELNIEDVCKNIINNASFIEKIKEEAKDMDFEVEVLKNQEEVIYSCYKFKNKDENKLTILDKKALEEEEAQEPTPTEKIKINSKEEYETILPDWTDEENETYKYRKFNYLIDNGLIDINSIKKDALNIAINDLDSYEYSKSNTNAARLALSLL